MQLLLQCFDADVAWGGGQEGQIWSNLWKNRLVKQKPNVIWSEKF